MSTGLGMLFSWMSARKKTVYFLKEGSLDDLGFLGNKGARLCEMLRLGMPVPPAFVISTDACNEYLDNKKVELQPELIQEYTKAIHELETQTEKCFGGDVKEKTPMLLSVRSSTPVSMPGMSETILNLGMNDEVFDALVSSSGNLRWACDTYRRFLQMFGVLVLGVERKHYDEILNTACRKGNFADETQLTVQDLQDIVQSFKTITAVPDDPWEQLRMAVEAIFASWYSAKGMRYRDVHNIPADIGTAVIVQSMVYGNANTRSGSGVAMTRNPTTGEKELFGEYSEGEEMADGVRTPVSLSTWQKEVPDLGEKLQHIEGILEKHFCDMQDIEFTVENGELYVLETRPAKRTARAAVRIAVEMVEEGLLTEREALLRFDPNQMDYFLNPVIDPSYRNENDPKVVERTLGKGLAGSDGTIVGKAVFDMKQAESCVNNGESCILILDDVTTAHRSALKIASGLLTMRGGRDTYGAEIMRALGKPCVMGASNLRLDAEKGELSVSPEAASSTTGPINHIIHAGDSLTIDGSSGMIYTGEIPTVSVGQDAHYMKVIFWADKYKRMDVYANAESRVDVLQADRMGADGIGSLRTERMLKKGSRIDLFRRAILTEDAMSRKQCLLQLLPLLQADFLEIFTFQNHRPVCVRLLDPPLGSFLSPSVVGVDDPVEGYPESASTATGCRGSRLSILHPEITEMLTKAVVGAAIEAKKGCVFVAPHIMIPLVVTDHEVDIITPMIRTAAESVCAAAGSSDSLDDLGVRIGSMIETPRACIRADRIADTKDINFLTIGSEELTKCVFGFEREETQSFMPGYLDKHIFAYDPLIALDTDGVGDMMTTAVRRAKRAVHGMPVGVCGEHTGDPASIQFLDRLGVDYISCSPYRIPIAKIAAAQATIAVEAAFSVHGQQNRHHHFFDNPHSYHPMLQPPYHNAYRHHPRAKKHNHHHRDQQHRRDPACMRETRSSSAPITSGSFHQEPPLPTFFAPK